MKKDNILLESAYEATTKPVHHVQISINNGSGEEEGLMQVNASNLKVINDHSFVADGVRISIELPGIKISPSTETRGYR